MVMTVDVLVACRVNLVLGRMGHDWSFGFLDVLKDGFLHFSVLI